jgi:cellulose biosynthesis protein BcsQ
MFTGKGGVGKTTCAAATALYHASRGGTTLAISTDATPSWGFFTRNVSHTCLNYMFLFNNFPIYQYLPPLFYRINGIPISLYQFWLPI